MLGWTTDLFRVAWGLFYWNARKTIFRVRKNRGPCPCQTLSDSGLAGETGCEPALLYEKPIRFRRVCPLLQPNARGELKCSVNTSEVRPFWFRFFGIYGGTLLATYLLSVAAVFGVMRHIGYPISFATLVWPPAWQEIDQVRSKYFLTQAEAAYSAGDGATALMSLSLAYEYDPANYETGRLLAQLWSAARPERANQVYEKLMLDHPDHRIATARAWFKGLLSRGDYLRLETLAAKAIVLDAESTSAWIYAFLFANQRTQNSGLIDELLESPAQLPSGVSELLQLEQKIRASNASDGRDLLTQNESPGEPLFLVHYRVRRLIQLGEANRALQLLNERSDRFQDRDRIRLQLAAYARGDFRDPYVDLVRKLIQLPPSLALSELLSAHLIVYPNLALYRLIKQSVAPADIASDDERLQSVLAFYFLALAHADKSGSGDIAAYLRETTGSTFASLDAAALVAADPARYRIQNVLPAIQPLSLDMIYALLERYENRSK